MGRFLLFILFTATCLSNSYSQDYDKKIVNTIIWQAEAKSGGKFIGIAPDAYEASIAIDEVKFIMEGTKYQILHTEIIETSLLIEGEKSIEEDFISDDEYLEYKYISEIELIALQYINKNGTNKAVSFYTSVCKEKNEEKVTACLNKLYINYSKYLFDTETPATLVTYSE